MTKLRVSKFKIQLFILHVVIFLVLEQVYVALIHPEYEYMGFLLEIDVRRQLLGKLFYLFILLVLMMSKAEYFLLSVLSFVVTFFLIPNIILYEFMNIDPMIPIGVASIPLLTLLFNKFTIKTHIPIPTLKENQKVFFLTAFTIFLIIPFIVTYGSMISWSVFSFEGIYSVREESESMSNRWLDYTYSSLSSWILPLCLVYGYLNRRVALVALGLAGLLYLFAVTGNRITFFVIFAVVSFLFFKTFQRKILVMYVALSIIYSVGYAMYNQFPQVIDLLARRFLFLPALLNDQYFEFFKNSPVYYSHSFLSRFVDYPFHDIPSKIIGAEYYSDKVNATNGIISDGYLNLGYVGIFVNTVVASLTLVYFNRLNLSPTFMGLFFLLVQRFIDGALSTLYITHGLLLFMILGFFIMKNTGRQTEVK